jgi:SAM-dependent methyltransferase
MDIHGYSLTSNYTRNFFRELTPDWIDLSLLVKGYFPPRQGKLSSFRYVELGCGMGLSLIITAAAYPNSDFIGIDYSAKHIEHAERLVARLNLTNVRFIQGDLCDLVNTYKLSGLSDGTVDYVVAHGLFTWVGFNVQNSILSLSSKLLRCGGVLYCSYNCKPGWLSAYIIRSLLDIFRHSSPGSSSLDLAKKAKHLIGSLGLSQEITSGTKSHPTLEPWLDFLIKQKSEYISQEFFSQWEPLFANDLHKQFSEYQLDFASTATYSDLIEDLIPESVRNLIVNSATMPADRETILDIASNKSFRRDIFIKGANVAPTSACREIIYSTILNAASSNDRIQLFQESPSFNSPFGKVKADNRAYSPIINKLINDNMNISELIGELQIPFNDFVNRILLLIDSSIIGVQSKCANGRLASLKTNKLILEMAIEGDFVGYLIAPNISSAVAVSPSESVILHALTNGMNFNNAVGFTYDCLSRLGGFYKRADGEAITDSEGITSAIKDEVRRIIDSNLPFLISVGALIADNH